MAFFVVASTAAFVGLGDMVVALVYRTGRFGAGDTLFVWAILAGFSLGLLAATQARLFSSAFYALGDTRTPFRIAIVRVVFGTVAGRGAGLRRAAAAAPRAPLGRGRPGRSPAAWPPGSSWSCCAGSWPGGWARSSPCPAGCWADCCWRAGWRPRPPATASSTLLDRLQPGPHPALGAALVLGVFGAVYVLLCALLRNPEALALLGRIARRMRRR